jgi:hypothetical protein
VEPLPPEARTGLLWTAIGLLVSTLWLFSPVLADLNAVVIGDPQTDAIRGAWGFQHLSSTIFNGELPWDSTRVNFPDGARLMVLPLASGLLLSPLGLLEPIFAYNLILMLLVFSSGLATAWLTQVVSDSWAAGFLAGTVLLAQPMLHHALADGTAEHMALWAVPLFIGAAWLALAEQNPKWGVGAGLFSIVVALDSPYHGLYALVLGIAVLPMVIKTVRGRETDLWRALGAMILAALVGVGFVTYLYQRFETGEVDGPGTAVLQGTNATDLRLWWRHFGDVAGIRDLSRPPTLIPTALFSSAVVLCAVATKRGAPWLIAGLAMVCMSFGTRSATPALMGAWLGTPAESLFNWVFECNQWIYSVPIAGEVRFPRRWLVPAAMSLAVGAGIGISAIFQRWIRPPVAQLALVMVAAALSLHVGVSASRLHNPFPVHKVPDVAFAAAIRGAEQTGAVLLLPANRAVEAGATREKLPVFANLGSVLASADDLYLQMRHGQPMVSFPSLQTLSARPRDADVSRVLRDWSDLTGANTSGRGIPPSAYDPGANTERERGLRKLREAGLRWVAVDLGFYEGEGLEHLKDQLGRAVSAEQRFEEGDGVLLLKLRSLAPTSGG